MPPRPKSVKEEKQRQFNACLKALGLVVTRGNGRTHIVSEAYPTVGQVRDAVRDGAFYELDLMEAGNPWWWYLDAEAWRRVVAYLERAVAELGAADSNLLPRRNNADKEACSYLVFRGLASRAHLTSATVHVVGFATVGELLEWSQQQSEAASAAAAEERALVVRPAKEESERVAVVRFLDQAAELGADATTVPSVKFIRGRQRTVALQVLERLGLVVRHAKSSWTLSSRFPTIGRLREAVRANEVEELAGGEVAAAPVDWGELRRSVITTLKRAVGLGFHDEVLFTWTKMGYRAAAQKAVRALCRLGLVRVTGFRNTLRIEIVSEQYATVPQLLRAVVRNRIRELAGLPQDWDVDKKVE